MSVEELCELIDAYAQDLKHETRASSVQIILTVRDKEDSSVCIGGGLGSFYERIGSCQTWINRETTR